MTRRRKKHSARSPRKREETPKSQKEAVSSSSKTLAVTGTLSLHPRGFGFVSLEKGVKKLQDVFIPKHLVNGAVDGDTVEVEVASIISAKGPEGRITKILKRGRKHLAGTVLYASNGSYRVFSPLLGKDKKIILTSEGKELKPGDRVIMKVLNWNNDRKETEGELKSLIGHITDPKADIPAAIEEFEIGSDFSDEVLAEAKQFGAKATQKDFAGREDFTKLETITIDPDTAKDFDDAISLTKDGQGNFYLGVHIADVAHYVKPGSALDREAYIRGNSTYFPGKCIPMLPEELSNGLCSLKADVIRLTASVMMTFDKQGTLVHSEVFRSYIHSRKRFTYREALAVLQEKKENPFYPLLKDAVDLCHLLKQKRMERGSIDFALPDAVLVIDENGEPQGVRIEEYDITHQLIEEFMLKANEMVAITLSGKGKMPLYRIHEQPSKENFHDFFSYVRALGFSMPDNPTNKDIQKLFKEAKGTPHINRLSIAFIRSMRIALYSPDNIGHYGLALEHYAHFTSPIRRYSDLVIQRLLFDEEPEDQDLTAIANHCSNRERISMRAEGSVTTLKKLRLMQKYFQDDPQRHYHAQITRIKPFGLFFELSEFMLEGSLHVSELGNDFFFFDQKHHAFRGERSGKTYSISDTIEVYLTGLDFIYQEAKFALVHSKPRKKPTSNDAAS